MISSIGLFNVEKVEIYTSDACMLIARYVGNIERMLFKGLFVHNNEAT